MCDWHMAAVPRVALVFPVTHQPWGQCDTVGKALGIPRWLIAMGGDTVAWGGDTEVTRGHHERGPKSGAGKQGETGWPPEVAWGDSEVSPGGPALLWMRSRGRSLARRCAGARGACRRAG